MKKRELALHIVLIAVSAAGGWLAGGSAIAAAVSVATALVALAGVVVTVFGIWIAIIFPKIMQDLGSGRVPKDVPETARYQALVSALYKSCFVLCSGFFVFIVISFYGKQDRNLMVAVAFFSWLSFFSITLSLWAAVTNGELAAGNGITQKLYGGLVKRVRGMGRRQKKR